MANKVNYHHARKQKEQARKARQQQKQQRRAERSPEPASAADAQQTEGGLNPQVSVAGDGT